MDDSKKWLMSRTLWGSLIAIVCSGLSIAGILQIDSETQGFLADSAVLIATSGLALVGGLAAVYGRVRATKTLRK